LPIKFDWPTGGTNQDWDPELAIFSDADSSGADRRSISGYIFLMARGAVAWSSKKQNTVALSTAEAEYVATTHAAKQALWYRSLFNELDLPLQTTTILYSDNQAAIAIAHHPARTKHIDTAHHFLRDLVETNRIEIIYVSTRDNSADLFTKGLPRVLHQDLTYGIGVLSN